MKTNHFHLEQMGEHTHSTLHNLKVIIVSHRIIMKLVHWPLIDGLLGLHLVQQGGHGMAETKSR